MKLEDITDLETLEELLIYSDLLTEQQTQALIQSFNRFSSIPVKRVLDIGCGFGRHSREMNKQGFQVIGIDISEEAIKIAKTKQEDIIYFVADLRTFESDEPFDLAYAHNSTMACFLDNADFILALSNINSLLKPGGLFIFDYFYPTNLVNQGRYKPDLYLTKKVDGLTLEKRSEHKLDMQDQIHYEKSEYVVSDGKNRRTFHKVETLKYYEPEQIKNILKQNGFSEIHLFDRDTYSHITDDTVGIYVITKK